MHEVHAHMDGLSLPKDVRRRVVHYFDFLWSRNKSGSDRKSFLDRISPSLKSEIALYQHRELITRVDFFRNMPVGFIISVCTRLEVKLFLPGDFIIRKDDFGSEMFFVHSGHCECIVSGKVVKIFHENEFFGEIALLRSEPVRRTATIKSNEFSELVVLYKHDFLECLAIHPDASQKVYKVMRKKLKGYKGGNVKRPKKTRARRFLYISVWKFQSRWKICRAFSTTAWNKKQ